MSHYFACLCNLLPFTIYIPKQFSCLNILLVFAIYLLLQFTYIFIFLLLQFIYLCNFTFQLPYQSQYTFIYSFWAPTPENYKLTCYFCQINPCLTKIQLPPLLQIKKGASCKTPQKTLQLLSKMKNQGSYLQHFIFFITYDWVQ
jgi:hypothetical protein